MATWYLVSSATRARVFEGQGTNQPWRELFDMVNPAQRQPRQDMVSDRPGRVANSASGQRQSFAEPTDPREHAAEDFARDIMHRLEAARNSDSFTGLVLVAPPHFLGLLRAAMGEPLRQCVDAEIGKDLTTEDTATLQAHVRQLS